MSIYRKKVGYIMKKYLKYIGIFIICVILGILLGKQIVYIHDNSSKYERIDLSKYYDCDKYKNNSCIIGKYSILNEVKSNEKGSKYIEFTIRYKHKVVGKVSSTTYKSDDEIEHILGFSKIVNSYLVISNPSIISDCDNPMLYAFSSEGMEYSFDREGLNYSSVSCDKTSCKVKGCLVRETLDTFNDDDIVSKDVIIEFGTPNTVVYDNILTKKECM